MYTLYATKLSGMHGLPCYPVTCGMHETPDIKGYMPLKWHKLPNPQYYLIVLNIIKNILHPDNTQNKLTNYQKKYLETGSKQSEIKSRASSPCGSSAKISNFTFRKTEKK